MPRTRSLAFSELKIGLLTVFAIVIAAVVVFALSGQGGFFWQRYHLKVAFADVGGLKPGAPVRVAGVEVGAVESVGFEGARVEVTLRVSRAMQSRITMASRASVGSLGLLGERTVDITASSHGEPVADWGQVPETPTAGDLGVMTDSATQGLQEATKLLKELRNGQGTLGRLFTDETLYRDVRGLVTAADHVATALERGRGTVGRLVNDPEAYSRLEASLQNLEEVTRRLNAGEGSLGRLLHDDAFARSLTSATAGVDTLMTRVNRGEGTAGKLVTDPTLYTRVSDLAGQLDQLTSRLNEGKGSAGELLHDRQLYENMNGAAAELRGLIGEIRKNPKKYLNVKMSLF
jgi:phospholipid/cholesterol/gamma-HCH transport system substrate-binding protein